MLRIKTAKWFRYAVSSAIALFFYGTFAPGICSGQEDTKELHVNPGDAIRLFVYDGALQIEKGRFISQFNDLELVVDGFGEISLYSLGKVHVAGMTAEKIRDKLTEKFKPYAKEPNVVVIPLIRLILRGEFGKPGMYRFSLSTSFWDMISEAGGIDNSYSLENMFIMREGEIIYKDFEDALYKASSLKDMDLQSGDEIIAPRVNRLSFRTIMRYFQFGSSIMLLYLALINNKSTK
ncbi:MAG: hypothetical protein GXO75_12865 [Calditrichaeota bacterium]|nr:hypothetical protein [Calditrichota bacterium]